MIRKTSLNKKQIIMQISQSKQLKILKYQLKKEKKI